MLVVQIEGSAAMFANVTEGEIQVFNFSRDFTRSRDQKVIMGELPWS